MSDIKTKITKFNPLTLRTEYEGEENFGSLQWSIRKGYPRISVFTDNKKRQPGVMFDANSIITAPFDIVTIQKLFTDMDKIIVSKPESKLAINCYNIKYANGVATQDVYLQAKVIVGKDAAGVIYLALVADGKRQIKFDILPNPKWFKFFDENGAVIEDKAILSAMHAKSYLTVLKKLMSTEGIKDNVTVELQESKKQETNSNTSGEHQDMLF